MALLGTSRSRQNRAHHPTHPRGSFATESHAQQWVVREGNRRTGSARPGAVRCPTRQSTGADAMQGRHERLAILWRTNYPVNSSYRTHRNPYICLAQLP